MKLVNNKKVNCSIEDLPNPNLSSTIVVRSLGTTLPILIEEHTHVKFQYKELENIDADHKFEINKR